MKIYSWLMQNICYYFVWDLSSIVFFIFIIIIPTSDGFSEFYYIISFLLK